MHQGRAYHLQECNELLDSMQIILAFVTNCLELQTLQLHFMLFFTCGQKRTLVHIALITAGWLPDLVDLKCFAGEAAKDMENLCHRS